MPDTELSNLTTTQMKSGITDFRVQAAALDEAGRGKTFWDNPDWPTYAGFLKSVPQYWQAVRSLGIWAFGKGYICPLTEHQIILENIRGWGNESFDEILISILMEKKTNGDAFAHIVRNENGTLVNLRKLNPSNVRIEVGEDGLIETYKHRQADGSWKNIPKEEMFHITNDRIGNEIHGTSVLEPCKWLIEWKQELMNDLRRLMHRSSIRVIYVDLDNTTKLGTIRNEYRDAIKNGEVLLLPGRKGVDFEIEQIEVPDTSRWFENIRYLDDHIYEILGISKIITGGVSGTTEANAKMGYMSFEQPYMTEQRLMEQDIWSQLAIRITFNRPASISSTMQMSEGANTGQTSIQQNDMMPKGDE